MNPQRQPDYAFGDKRQNKDYYWYAPDPFAIQSTDPVINQTINISDDGDFYWTATSYQISIAGALLTEATNIIPLITINIVDTGSQRNLMNIPVPLAAIAGDGKRPYRLPKPRIFTRNSTIQLKFVPFLVAGTIYTVQFVMHGYKNYGQGAPY